MVNKSKDICLGGSFFVDMIRSTPKMLDANGTECVREFLGLSNSAHKALDMPEKKFSWVINTEGDAFKAISEVSASNFSDWIMQIIASFTRLKMGSFDVRGTAAWSKMIKINQENGVAGINGTSPIICARLEKEEWNNGKKIRGEDGSLLIAMELGDYLTHKNEIKFPHFQDLETHLSSLFNDAWAIRTFVDQKGMLAFYLSHAKTDGFEFSLLCTEIKFTKDCKYVRPRVNIISNKNDGLIFVNGKNDVNINKVISDMVGSNDKGVIDFYGRSSDPIITNRNGVWYISDLNSNGTSKFFCENVNMGKEVKMDLTRKIIYKSQTKVVEHDVFVSDRYTSIIIKHNKIDKNFGIVIYSEGLFEDVF